MSEFLSMGGYGTFMWAAFGLSTVVLVGLLVQSQRFLKASKAELDALQPDQNDET